MHRPPQFFEDEVVRKWRRDHPEIIQTDRRPAGPVSSIVSFVCSEMRVGERAVYGNDKTRQPSLARHIAMWIARRKLSSFFSGSTTVVARVIGGRDHSTVVTATQRIDRLRDTDEKFRAWTDDLLARAP